jgi:hypothetical protein
LLAAFPRPLELPSWADEEDRRPLAQTPRRAANGVASEDGTLRVSEAGERELQIEGSSQDRVNRAGRNCDDRCPRPRDLLVRSLAISVRDVVPDEGQVL